MKKSYILAGIAIIGWSTLAPITKLLVTDLPNMQVLFISSSIAFLFLFLFNCNRKNLHILRSYTFKDIAIQAGLGTLGLFLYTSLFNFGVESLSSQDANIINYLWPLMIILFSIPILKEKLTFRKIAAVLLSFFGLLIIVTRGNFSAIEMENLAGVFACIGAAVCSGLFSVLNKKTNYNQFIGMMLFFGVTALFSGIGFLIGGNFQPLTMAQTGGLLWLGIAANAIAYLTWALALKIGETAKISNLAYIIPFLAIILSAVLVGENVYAHSIIGLLFIILGIVIQNVKLKKQERVTS